MKKEVYNTILTLIGLVMVLCACWFIKSYSAAQVVHIIGSLIFIRMFYHVFDSKKKNQAIWCYVGTAVFVVNIVLCLIKLSL